MLKTLKMRWLGAPLVFLLVYVWGAPRLFGDCRSPHYRIGKFYKNTPSSVVVDISIAPEDFAPERLICLASILRQKYPQHAVSVGIFTSYRAAQNYMPLTVEYPTKGVLWASKQHAQYYYNAEEHKDYLLLIPDGLSLDPSSSFNTRIDLPVSGKPSCNLAIADRYLLEFDHIELPVDASPETVVLTARIQTNGEIADVKVAPSSANSSRREEALTALAARNLKSWRFERSGSDTPVTIAYSVERVDTPLEHGMNVQFELPDRVKIQIGPLLSH